MRAAAAPREHVDAEHPRYTHALERQALQRHAAPFGTRLSGDGELVFAAAVTLAAVNVNVTGSTVFRDSARVDIEACVLPPSHPLLRLTSPSPPLLRLSSHSLPLRRLTSPSPPLLETTEWVSKSPA